MTKINCFDIAPVYYIVFLLILHKQCTCSVPKFKELALIVTTFWTTNKGTIQDVFLETTGSLPTDRLSSKIKLGEVWFNALN